MKFCSSDKYWFFQAAGLRNSGLGRKQSPPWQASGGHMYSRECLLPDTKGHPESRLAKLSSSDTETAEEMNSSDKRHPQLDTYLKLII